MIGGTAPQSEHQETVDRVLRRAEISRLTRNLKSKLAIATLKTQGHSPLSSPTSTEHQATLPFKTFGSTGGINNNGSNGSTATSLGSEHAPRKRAKTLEGTGQPLSMTPTGMPAPSRVGRRTDPRRSYPHAHAQSYQGSPLRNSVRPLSHPAFSGAYESPGSVQPHPQAAMPPRPASEGDSPFAMRTSPLQYAMHTQTPTKMPPQPHMPTPMPASSSSSASTSPVSQGNARLQFAQPVARGALQIPTLDVTPPPSQPRQAAARPAQAVQSVQSTQSSSSALVPTAYSNSTVQTSQTETESEEPLPAEPSTPPPPGRANPKTPVRTPMRTPRTGAGRDRLDRDGANLLLYLATSPGRGSTTPRTPRTPDFNLNDYLYLYSPSPGRPGMSTHGAAPLAVPGTPKRILGMDDLNRDIFGHRQLGTPGGNQASSKLLGPPPQE